MKVLVLVSCILAVGSAAYVPRQPYNGPIHHPVIEHGVPVEPAEIQQARAEHYAALTKAAALAGPYVEEKYEEQQDNRHGKEQYVFAVQYATPAADHHYQPQQNYRYQAPAPTPAADYHYEPQQNYRYQAPAPAPAARIRYSHTNPAYKTTDVIPAIGHDGRPLDTPEVEAAKAQHFAAFNEALSHVARRPQNGGQQYYRNRRSIDEHEEKIEVPKGSAELKLTHHGYVLHQKHAPIYGHHGEHYIPKYDHHGLPLDTDEVEEAKAAHFAVHAMLGNNIL